MLTNTSRTCPIVTIGKAVGKLNTSLAKKQFYVYINKKECNMFWRIPVKTIGSVLGASAFKKGDLIRTWDELGKWDYYVYEGCPDTDDKWLVGDKLGISTYIEAPLTDFQVTKDATREKYPLLHEKLVDIWWRLLSCLESINV